MTNAENLKGQVFGKLTVVEPLFERQGRASTIWICECNCKEDNKNQVRVSAFDLNNEKIKSCGCLTKQNATTHGLRYSSEYNIWNNMRTRCHNPNSKDYKDYGGRGITVCDEWRDSFETFYRDMGPRPSMEHSIDRERNNEGYSPNNCRWATKTEQANNRRNNIFYDYNGVSKTLVAWCKELNLHYITINNRIYNLGWSFEKAITEPIQKSNYTHNGKTQSLSEWCRELNLKYKKVHYLLSIGISFEEAIRQQN